MTKALSVVAKLDPERRFRKMMARSIVHEVEIWLLVPGEEVRVVTFQQGLVIEGGTKEG